MDKPLSALTKFSKLPALGSSSFDVLVVVDVSRCGILTPDDKDEGGDDVVA